MQVFGALLSPFVRKVCLVAEEKGIAYELVMTGPGSSNPDFAAASPFGKIPALKDGDYTLANSTAIITYLEARHPAHPMLPADPQARGRAMWFDEFADTILAGAGLKSCSTGWSARKSSRSAAMRQLPCKARPNCRAFSRIWKAPHRRSAGCWEKVSAWRISRSLRCSAR